MIQATFKTKDTKTLYENAQVWAKLFGQEHRTRIGVKPTFAAFNRLQDHMTPCAEITVHEILLLKIVVSLTDPEQFESDIKFYEQLFELHIMMCNVLRSDTQPGAVFPPSIELKHWQQVRDLIELKIQKRHD